MTKNTDLIYRASLTPVQKNKKTCIYVIFEVQLNIGIDPVYNLPQFAYAAYITSFFNIHKAMILIKMHWIKCPDKNKKIRMSALCNYPVS